MTLEPQRRAWLEGVETPVLRCLIAEASEVLFQRRVAERMERTTMASLLEGVAFRYGLTVADLKGPRYTWRLAHPRQEFMYEARLIGKSYPQIGRFLGRDHTTVIHGVRAHLKRQQNARQEAA